MRALPALPVVIPLVVAAALMMAQHWISRLAGSLIAISTALLTAIACGVLLDVSLSHTIQYWFGGWTPRDGFALGIEFSIDPIGAAMATLIAVLGAAALIFSIRYFDTAGMIFPSLMLIFIGAMCGFSLTGDLFNLFVFFELMSVAAFALCAYKSEDPGTVQGAWNFAVINSVGAFLIVTGIAFLYSRTSALNMAQIGDILKNLRGSQTHALIIAAFTFIAGGFMIKAAIVPFHFWLDDAHAVAPTPVCVLFSGAMVELALYGIARVYWVIFSSRMTPQPGLRGVLIGFAAVTAIVGALMCFGQRNLKRMLAFSTVSHSGMIAVGIGLLVPQGLAGAALYTLGHGVSKASLFLAAGILLHRLGDLDEFKLHGRGGPIPVAAIILILGAAGLSGFPPSATHTGDTLMMHAARDAGIAWIKYVSMISTVLTSAAVFRYVARVFFGWGSNQPLGGPGPTAESSETGGGHDRTPLGMYLPGLVLALAGVSLGLVHLSVPAARAAARFEGTVSSGQALPLLPDALNGFTTLAIALLLAAFSIFSLRVRKIFARLGRAAHVVRDLHNGHVGDYAAWAMFGIAVLGISLLALS